MKAFDLNFANKLEYWKRTGRWPDAAERERMKNLQTREGQTHHAGYVRPPAGGMQHDPATYTGTGRHSVPFQSAGNSSQGGPTFFDTNPNNGEMT